MGRAFFGTVTNNNITKLQNSNDIPEPHNNDDIHITLSSITCEPPKVCLSCITGLCDLPAGITVSAKVYDISNPPPAPHIAEIALGNAYLDCTPPALSEADAAQYGDESQYILQYEFLYAWASSSGIMEGSGCLPDHVLQAIQTARTAQTSASCSGIAAELDGYGISWLPITL